MSAKGKTVLILVENMYEDIELWYPYYRLIEEGAKVLLVGPEKTDFKGKYGYPATADLAAKDVKVENVDAILIPGGFAPDYL
ncbi:MAG TPA: DJ-1/PfpI family protein, partial [Candidatus Deferrimicrobium sp.]|nr:DJ-1/PfpI family protein [Candidatus Deferrimicrobium sp.]